MKTPPIPHDPPPRSLPKMPSWVRSTRAGTTEELAFLSGAALCTLHMIVMSDDIPHALIRARLALRAAEACVICIGHPQRATDLRDAVHLLRPGEQTGPAGAIYQMWREVVMQPITGRGLHKALTEFTPSEITGWLNAAEGCAVGQAASVLETVLTADPRAETAALIMADAALARALRWGNIVPVLATALTPRDLRKTGDDLRHACHRAVISSATDRVRIAADLTRRVDRLKSVVPKLRARGAGPAVALFLSNDAMAPAALPLPDRAARRLCDRLVDLGMVRELTGRDTFRLYGV